MSNITTFHQHHAILVKLSLLFLLTGLSLSFTAHPSNSRLTPELNLDIKPTRRTESPTSIHLMDNNKVNENKKQNAPLYITVGPQCSGKTTFLNKDNIKDVSIDGQNRMYHQVPLRYYIKPTKDDQKVMNETIINGKSLAERVKENHQEISFASKRAFRRSNSSEDSKWKKDLKKMFQLDIKDDNDATYVKEKKLFKDVKEAVIEFCNATKGLDKVIDSTALQYDLFIPEALFGGGGGISLAGKELYELASKEPGAAIAWGNTNTLSRDYKNALDIAMKTRRPVRFIVYNDPSISSKSADRKRYKLPRLHRKEILHRNLERFYATGRYIPIRSIVNSMERCTSLLSAAAEKLQSIENDFPDMDEEWYLDCALCQLAGYELTTERYVKRMKGKNGGNKNTGGNSRNKKGTFDKVSPDAASKKRHDATSSDSAKQKKKGRNNKTNNGKTSKSTNKSSPDAASKKQHDATSVDSAKQKKKRRKNKTNKDETSKSNKM